MILVSLVFLSSFGLYLTTLCGTVPAYRDSGDMLNAVFTLGIAHPPGYPLYVLTGKLLSVMLPFANVAYRVNVSSALFAAASAALLYQTTALFLESEHTGSRWAVSGAAFIAALFFACSPAVLTLARVSEMYTLAALFAAGILACSIINTPRSLLLGSYLLGSGFGVHPTLLFLAPLLLPTRSSDAKDWFRQSLNRLGFFLLGFSVIIFLLLRAKAGPIQNWGDPSTWKTLWQLITRSNYGGLKLHPVESRFSWTAGGIADQVFYFSRTFLSEWGWAGVGAGFMGLFFVFRSGSAARFPSRRLMFCWLLSGPFFFILSNLPIGENTTTPILQPALVLVNLLWAFWAAVGLYQATRWVKAPATLSLLLILIGLVPLNRLRASFHPERDHFYGYDLGRNFMRTLPHGAVLYNPDDSVAFTLRSLQLLEHRREDIVLLNFFQTYWGYRQIVQRWPDLLPPVNLQNAQELGQMFWAYSAKKRPFYVDLPMKIPSPQSYRVEGIAYSVLPKPEAPTSVELQRSEAYSPLYVWRGVWRTTIHPDFFTQHIFNYPAAARCNLGLAYGEREEWGEARRHYLQALCIDPEMAAAYNNLGVADFRQNRFDSAMHNYLLALRFDPANAGYRNNLEMAKKALFPIALP